ncbi:MAG TPA: hypothetical protein DIS75_03825 [Chryseobacterium sp.]|nr:hypothetical protein [Chryseobacterium sp.]
MHIRKKVLSKISTENTAKKPIKVSQSHDQYIKLKPHNYFDLGVFFTGKNSTYVCTYISKKLFSNSNTFVYIPAYSYLMSTYFSEFFYADALSELLPSRAPPQILKSS